MRKVIFAKPGHLKPLPDGNSGVPVKAIPSVPEPEARPRVLRWLHGSIANLTIPALVDEVELARQEVIILAAESLPLLRSEEPRLRVSIYNIDSFFSRMLAACCW